MHYSNTSLKIASLFLPRSYLCFPASSLSRFKSDRGSLDRRNTGSIYTLVGRQQSKRLKPVSAVTTHRDILHLSQEWEINFMMRIPCAKENIGLIVERLVGSAFLPVSYFNFISCILVEFHPTFNLLLCLLHWVVSFWRGSNEMWQAGIYSLN